MILDVFSLKQHLCISRLWRTVLPSDRVQPLFWRWFRCWGLCSYSRTICSSHGYDRRWKGVFHRRFVDSYPPRQRIRNTLPCLTFYWSLFDIPLDSPFSIPLSIMFYNSFVISFDTTIISTFHSTFNRCPKLQLSASYKRLIHGSKRNRRTSTNNDGLKVTIKQQSTNCRPYLASHSSYSCNL